MKRGRGGRLQCLRALDTTADPGMTTGFHDTLSGLSSPSSSTLGALSGGQNNGINGKAWTKVWGVKSLHSTVYKEIIY